MLDTAHASDTAHSAPREAASAAPAPGRAAASGPTSATPAAPGRVSKLSTPQDTAALASATPATRLPYFDQIQRAFGRHSVANVRARIGGAAGQAAQQLGARGFAYGEDVALRDGADLHLVAHEAAHVIQQRGRARFSGMGQIGDEHEQHAEQVAHKVEAGESAEALLDEYAPGSAGTGSSSPGAVQLFAGERPFHDYGAVTSDPAWMPAADGYEKRLGVYAYNHGRSTSVVSAALDRMGDVLMQHFAVAEDDRPEKEKLFQEAFTKHDPTSAGQIGRNAKLKTIMEMLRTGNLRERMTAFYNAAYYNSSGSAPGRGFKQIAKTVLFDGDMTTAHNLGLDEGGMQNLSQFMTGSWSRWGLQKSTQLLDWVKIQCGGDPRGGVGYNFSDDPFALGNLALAREYTGVGGIGTSQWGRTERSPVDKAGRGHTAKYYKDLGIPLSQRELQYARNTTPQFHANPSGANLSWVPGDAYWQMPNSSVWISQIRDQLHMPIIGGVSGTTTRMLSAFQWLNTGASALDFRLALMGWMLPMGDHSLYEILRGAQLAGVFHPDEGNLGDVVRMYMNVGPLATQDLRSGAGKNAMFPHEEVYLAKAKNPVHSPTGFLGVDGTSNHATANVPNPGFNEAHAAAIYAYTSGMHMIMNSILETKRMPRAAAHRLVKSKLMGYVDYQARLELLEAKELAATITLPEQTELGKLQAEPVEPIEVVSGELATWLVTLANPTLTPDARAAYRKTTVEAWMTAQMPRIYSELLAHTNMTVEGLAHMPAVPPTTVWRGDWQNMFWTYGVGSKIPVNVLRSFSRDRGVAEGFMSNGKFSNKVLLKVQTKVNGAGRDVKQLSVYGGEDEVLMMPGTMLVVSQVDTVGDYTVLTCDEQ